MAKVRLIARRRLTQAKKGEAFYVGPKAAEVLVKLLKVARYAPEAEPQGIRGIVEDLRAETKELESARPAKRGRYARRDMRAEG